MLPPPPSSTLFPYTTLFRSPPVHQLHRLPILQIDARNQHGNRTSIFLAAKNIERSEEHTSELQSRFDLVCRLLLEKKKKTQTTVVPSCTDHTRQHTPLHTHQ